MKPNAGYRPSRYQLEPMMVAKGVFGRKVPFESLSTTDQINALAEIDRRLPSIALLTMRAVDASKDPRAAFLEVKQDAQIGLGCGAEEADGLVLAAMRFVRPEALGELDQSQP
jgi:hypothetical protein